MTFGEVLRKAGYQTMLAGKTIRELPTTHIPGVIAAANGTVVAATWKDGKVMGSIERYDRRRMDWEIGP